ncbi:hypothetical protein OG21DRAFT_1511264 [Imleria badia]|nr:hypothetical protein OG21DRAFT_1511264 [Imleria badia]
MQGEVLLAIHLGPSGAKPDASHTCVAQNHWHDSNWIGLVAGQREGVTYYDPFGCHTHIPRSSEKETAMFPSSLLSTCGTQTEDRYRRIPKPVMFLPFTFVIDRCHGSVAPLTLNPPPIPSLVVVTTSSTSCLSDSTKALEPYFSPCRRDQVTVHPAPVSSGNHVGWFVADEAVVGIRGDG